MRIHSEPRPLGTVLAACLAALGWLSPVLAAATDTNALSPANPPVELTSAAALTNPTTLVLTQDLSAVALEAIERVRLEAVATARTNAAAFAERLQTLEQTLMAQRERELAVLRESNHLLLLVVGVLAGAGLFGVFLIGWFQLRAMRRFAEAAGALPMGQTLSLVHSPVALGAGEMHLVAANAAEQSSTRFLTTLERLEQRIHELEHTTAPLPPSSAAQANGEQFPLSVGPPLKSLVSGALAPAARAAHGKARAAGAANEKLDRAALLLGKGQALLSLGQGEDALACFDEAVALAPQNVEALVKRGTALERLKRLEEAIECYDRAIALDGAQTLAYLHKGAACNRLARFGEALACYEKALQSQKEAAPQGETPQTSA